MLKALDVVQDLMVGVWLPNVSHSIMAVNSQSERRAGSIGRGKTAETRRVLASNHTKAAVWEFRGARMAGCQNFGYLCTILLRIEDSFWKKFRRWHKSRLCGYLLDHVTGKFTIK